MITRGIASLGGPALRRLAAGAAVGRTTLRSASLATVLGAMVLAAAAAPDWTRAEGVNVVATDYEFQPSRLTFRVDVPIRLHLENRGQELHEFTAPVFLKSVEVRNPDVLTSDGSEVVIQPGEQKDLFFVPTQRGRFSFICADHDWAGMTGEIVVD